jgi:hypothetical protein
MRNTFLLLFFVLLFPFLSRSQDYDLGFNLDAGVNLPVFNEAPLRITYNASTAIFLKFNKNKAFSFIPALYAEKTSNRFNVLPDFTFVNDLYRFGINIGTSMMLNINWYMIANLNVSYLFYNSIYTVYEGTNYTPSGRTSNSELSNNENKFIPGLGLSLCYAVSKRFAISFNYKQALLSSYSNDKFYIFGNNLKTINFNNKESKLTVSLIFNLIEKQ